MSTNKATKKIIIRPFRPQVAMDPNYAEKTWKLLKNAICEIHKQNASGLSFEELYRNAYNMVLHKYGDMLYKGLSKLVEEHLKTVGDKVAAAVDDVFLSELHRAWSEHKISMLMIRDILMYLDRVYVLQHRVPAVYDLGLIVFRDTVSRNTRIKPRILKLALELIHRERRGEVVDRSVLKSLTQMLIDVGVTERSVYEEDFEKPFLEATTNFYRAESQEFIASNSCSDYMKKAEVRIREELDRVTQYLDLSTEPKLKEVVEGELIATHMKALLEMEASGLVSMVKESRVVDLQRMYNLLGRIKDGHQTMRDMLAAHIKAEGLFIVTDEEKARNPLEFIQALLTLKDRCDELLDKAFGRDKAFVQSINAAFEHFVNQSSRTPEFASLFIDDRLKKATTHGASDDEVDVVMDKVIMLFRYVQEKDVFERYYKQHLAKRLLTGRTASDDAERSMIAKLKLECGYQFTSKLEGMFSDCRTSVDTNEGYKQWLAAKQETPKVELYVNVLTTGFWPIQAIPLMCNLPAEIVHACELFKSYYLSSHSGGRRLTWQTNLGAADLKMQITPRKHEVNVTTHQMVVLMHFNDRSKITLKELQELTAIPIQDLKRALFSLSCSKIRVLVKAPMPAESGTVPTIAESDEFAINTKFKCNMVRIKLLGLGQKTEGAPKGEVSETRQKVDEDRGLAIEAAVVRTMKARKTMDHQQLVIEVTKQLASRFMPDPIHIKRRIESLIEREYLERSKTDRKIYNYLA